MRPTGYDLDYVNALFNALGERGRETYLTTQIPVDMIYPLLFGVSYSLVIGYFLNKLNKLQAPYAYLCVLPIISGVADYVENFGIIFMLSKYPDLPQALVTTTSIFSVIKSVSTTVFFVSLITVLLVLGFQAMNRKKTTANNI